MNLSPTAQATLLLTSNFSKAHLEDAKPLTNAEWGRFALWLKEKSMTPANLLVSEPALLLGSWHDARVSSERIIQLLNRGHGLALAMEKWQRAGLWVVTRSDPEYPWRLKQRLKTDSPPVLFGCGNKALLNAGGLAVVGSRNASDDDLAWGHQAGGQAAAEGYGVVSGGARGVDETAMLGALQQGGTVTGVMADSLLKAATSARWRKALMNGQLVLLSPFYPEAGFTAGNAMARNKYIYCLADSALVVHSGSKGGTFTGADQNLKKNWVPLWVKPTADSDAANAGLVASGGRWCQPTVSSAMIAELMRNDGQGSRMNKEQADLFSSPERPVQLSAAEPGAMYDVTENASEQRRNATAPDDAPPEAVSQTIAPSGDRIDFYQIFISALPQLATSPATPEELIAQTGLHKSQLSDWLKRASDEGVVEKLSHPVRYQIKQGVPDARPGKTS